MEPAHRTDCCFNYDDFLFMISRWFFFLALLISLLPSFVTSSVFVVVVVVKLSLKASFFFVFKSFQLLTFKSVLGCLHDEYSQRVCFPVDY